MKYFPGTEINHNVATLTVRTTVYHVSFDRLLLGNRLAPLCILASLVDLRHSMDKKRYLTTRRGINRVDVAHSFGSRICYFTLKMKLLYADDIW